MAYALEDFCNDARQSLTSKSEREGPEEVRLHLERLLVDEEFVARHAGSNMKPGKETIYTDPELGFTFIVYNSRAGRAESAPHDHGNSWAIYGQAKFHTGMRDWEKLDPSLEGAKADVRETRKYQLDPGQAELYHRGDIHSIHPSDNCCYVRVAETPADEFRPVGRKKDLLWTPADVFERLEDTNLRIIDCRPGERFAMGHIPDARNFDIYAVNCDDTDDAPLNSFVRMWAFLLGNRGVSFDDTVLFYEDRTGSTAARGFWFLEYLGHPDVHVMDPGFSGWERDDFPITRDAEVHTAAPFEYTPNRERLATYQDVLEAIDRPDAVILDTRNDGEWLGTDVHAARGGAVPNAVHLNWTNHLTEDGTMKPEAELRAQFEAIGVTPDKEIIPYCQTGYRSAHAYLALRLLGYPRVRNYLGSWKEWGNKESLPVVIPES
jgi:thiosulfate/3-mercaptopyruvate sulfurtransferase